MIERREILKAWQINLLCKDCRIPMKFDGVNCVGENPILYKYRCQKCGATKESNMTYPHQMFSLGEPVITEE